MPGTRCVSGRELKQMHDRLGAKKTVQHLSEALDKKHLRPDDFSIKDLAANLVKNGGEWVDSMNPGKSGSYHLLEAGSVEYGAFSNITGQIFYTEIKEQYLSEDFVFSKLVETKKSTLPGIEKIPGFGGIGDQFQTPIKENDPYPFVGVTEDYLHVGEKRKRGGIIAVTKEAIFGDRTGHLLDYCKEIGWYLGLSKEVRIIDTILDANSMAASIHSGGSRYHWKNSSYAAYQSTSPWINVKASTALSDWTSIQSAELILAAITDPYTGLPVMIESTHLIVPPDLKWTAQRIVTAGDVKTTTPGYASSGSPNQFTAPNPVSDAYTVVSSRLFKSRVAAGVTGGTVTGAAATNWYMGNPKKAVRYYSNWDAITTTLGAGSEAEFHRDVVTQTKVSEKGHPAWLNPRFMLAARSGA